MTLKCIFTILLYIMMSLESIACFTIITDEPVTNATMYAAYPKLFGLNMSNQTAFELPVDKALLIHDELSRFVCNNCGVHSIYRASLSQLPRLSYLILENNKLQYVHPDAFEHNTRLEKVNFAGNQLSTFNPDATIRNIPSLTLMDLSWNEQLDLNQVTLKGTSFIIFTCDHCGTTYLDQKTMSNMPRVSELNLSFNKLERIDDNALTLSKYIKTLVVDGNSELQRLNLKSVSLKKLSAEGCGLEGALTTSNLPRLESINVRSNRIAQVDEFGFLQNPNIVEVLLDNNLIQKIPMDLLRLPLNRLKRLCLDRNVLQPHCHTNEAKVLYSTRDLRKDCFEDGHHLKQFENFLRHSSGKAVYKNQPIHQLGTVGTTIDLSNQDIVYIEPDYLIDEQNVIDVLFDNNYRFDFHRHRLFLKSSSVERMSLQNCSITEIYEMTFKELPGLKSLELQGNKIKYIDSNMLFHGNPGLKLLSLSNNNIEFLSTQTFRSLPNLEVLELDRNHLLSNRAGTPFLFSASLRKFSCIQCQFESVNNMTLTGLPNLRELNLEHNRIKFFEPNLARSTHLRTLCLANNPSFDFGHEKNAHLLDNVQRMKKLDETCNDRTFSSQLERWHDETKQKAKYETEGITMSMRQARESSETSSAVAQAINLPISIAMIVVCYWRSVLWGYSVT